MSKERAKRKQRQRARAEIPAASAAERRERAERRAAERAPEPRVSRPEQGDGARRPDAPPRVSRLEERDGVGRPDAIWAPFPLTEIGMAVGIALFAIGFFSGGGRGVWLLTIAVLLLSVVVAELCVREHFAGFRSHSLLLGLLPVTVAHVGVFTFVTDAWRGPVALVVDLAIAGGLALVLQRRFRLAQERAQLQAPR